jgi:predicted nucleic acid-binding protein
MAEILFADTSFLVARFNRKDQFGARAERFLAGVAAGELPAYRLVTSEYVFDETVTTIHAVTRRHDSAVSCGDSIRSSRTVKLMPVEAVVIERAWELFKSRKDKKWSFTDCVSFTLMETAGIRGALTFDMNFREAGFATYP